MHRPFSLTSPNKTPWLLRAGSQHLHSVGNTTVLKNRPGSYLRTSHHSHICVQSHGNTVATQAHEKSRFHPRREGPAYSLLSGQAAAARSAQHRSQGGSSSIGHVPHAGPSRREFLLASVNLGVLADISIGGNDPSTILNSVLGELCCLLYA